MKCSLNPEESVTSGKLSDTYVIHSTGKGDVYVLFFLLFLPFFNVTVFTSCQWKAIFTCRLLVLCWAALIWCVTFKEICCTQRGPCVGKAQLQHHVPAVVAFLMENGCQNYFISGAEVMETSAGFTSDFSILVNSWIFPVTCIVILSFLCLRVEDCYSSPLPLLLRFSHYPRPPAQEHLYSPTQN